VSLDALAARWREEAELFRRRGAVEAAATLADCATALEEALHAHALVRLTVSEAALESGLSESALRRRFPCRKGQKGEARIPRADLPRKGGRAAPDGPDLAGALLADRPPGAPR